MWPSPPPAPTPQRGPRPSDVVLAVQLWAFVIVTSMVSRVAQSFSSRGSDLAREQFERQRQGEGVVAKAMRQTYPDFESYDTAMFVVALATTVVGAAIAVVFVFLMWKGQSWARVVLQLIAAFVVVQGIFGFLSGEALIAVPAILAAVVVVGALISANTRESQEFFKPGSIAKSPS